MIRGEQIKSKSKLQKDQRNQMEAFGLLISRTYIISCNHPPTTNHLLPNHQLDSTTLVKIEGDMMFFDILVWLVCHRCDHQCP